MDNAVAGGRWASRHVYVNSFYLAATMLAEGALSGEPKDLLFYPMCYNYRHCIELHLKALVVEARKLHTALAKRGEAPEELPPEPKNIMTKHGLRELLEYAEQLLSLYSEEKIDPTVRESILDLDEIDFDGQAFRYDSRKGDVPTLPNESWVDVHNVMERMNKAHFCLLGIDMWMADKRW